VAHDVQLVILRGRLPEVGLAEVAHGLAGDALGHFLKRAGRPDGEDAFSAVTYSVRSSRLNDSPAKVLPPFIMSLDATRRTFKEAHRFAAAAVARGAKAATPASLRATNPTDPSRFRATMRVSEDNLPRHGSSTSVARARPAKSSECAMAASGVLRSTRQNAGPWLLVT